MRKFIIIMSNLTLRWLPLVSSQADDTSIKQSNIVVYVLARLEVLLVVILIGYADDLALVALGKGEMLVSREKPTFNKFVKGFN